MDDFKGSSSGGLSTGHLIGSGGSGESSNKSDNTMVIVIVFVCFIGVIMLFCFAVTTYQSYSKYKMSNPNGTFFGMIQQKFSSMFSSHKE
jgi:hypothetical protein